MAEFDFAGLILLLGGTVCLLLGFNQSETSCMCSRLSHTHGPHSVHCSREFTSDHLITHHRQRASRHRCVVGMLHVQATDHPTTTIQGNNCSTSSVLACSTDKSVPDANHCDHPHHSLPACLRILRSVVLSPRILPSSRCVCHAGGREVRACPHPHRIALLTCVAGCCPSLSEHAWSRSVQAFS